MFSPNIFASVDVVALMLYLHYSRWRLKDRVIPLWQSKEMALVGDAKYTRHVGKNWKNGEGILGGEILAKVVLAGIQRRSLKVVEIGRMIEQGRDEDGERS